MFIYITQITTFLQCSFNVVDDDPKGSCGQYLISNDTNSASFGDLSHIINVDNETICIKFESHAGNFDYTFI